MKECSLCKTKKGLSDFYFDKNRKGNFSVYCRSCTREYQKSSKRREYQKEYLRGWRETGVLLYKYKNNPDYKQSILDSNKKYYKKNKTKIKAESRLRYLVRIGKLVRPNKCESCLLEGRVHGHHPDYNFPENVKWLCPRCHSKEHSKF